MAESSSLSPKIIGIILIPVILLLSLIAASYLFQTPIPNQMDITVQKIGGQNIDTLSFKGKVLVIEFFATYCDYCVETAQNFVSIMQNSSVSNVLFLSVSIDPVHDSDKRLNEFIANNNFTDYVGTNWLLTRDMTEQYVDYGVSATPHTFLINTNSQIVDQHVGLMTFTNLYEWLTNSTLTTTLAGN